MGVDIKFSQSYLGLIPGYLRIFSNWEPKVFAIDLLIISWIPAIDYTTR